MSDNNHHEWHEALERLLQEGQPTSDKLSNDLVATVPKARPAFQQRLEQQLVETWRLEVRSTKPSTIPATNLRGRQERLKSDQRSYPLTLVAAIVALLLGLAIVLSMTVPEPDESESQAFAAMGEAETSTAIWSHEATLKATVMANLNSVQAEAARQATEHALQTATPFATFLPGFLGTPVPPTVGPPVDAFMQTATAIIARATYEVAGTAFAEAQARFDEAQQLMPLEATVVRPDTENGTICQIVDPTGSAVLHAQPRVGSEVVGMLPAESRLDVTTVVVEAQSGATWLYVEYVQLGQWMSGWVRADDVRVLAICFYEDREYALLNGRPEETVAPLPTVSAIPTVTATPIATASPTHTFTPTQPATATVIGSMSFEVDILVTDPGIASLFPLVGELVDVFMTVGDVGQDAAVIAVARRVRLISVQGETVTRATVIARDAEQAELLAGLAASGIELKLSPAA